ncbi:MAG TPA: glycosyltransferase, partial [Sumerlaeia bacterium]|nr:glycosyltransferase [Sumerlaeia bacterium]
SARENEQKDAEIDALRLRLGRIDQQEIDLQNARAELDALKIRLGQFEQKEIDLQNARAELDALRTRLGRLEQKEIDLQNARAELDALRIRLGQFEQKEIDLQNARAELMSAHEQLGALTRERSEWERTLRAQAASFEREKNAYAERLAAAERQRAAARSEMERTLGELEKVKKGWEDLEARCQSLMSYQEAQQRTHAALQKAYDRTWVRRGKLAVLKLGRNRCESRQNYEAKILQLAKPSVAHAAWAETADAAERSFLIITHDQQIDRRILQQADALIQDGWRGMIVCVSLDSNDHIDRDAHGLPMHRVGLNRVVPNCKVYWKYHNRQRLIDWWGRWHLRLSRWNLSLYEKHWQWRYGSKKMACPLPFDNAFYEAGRHYRADLVIAEDLPALPAAARLAREWQVPLIYDSHELYAEQKAFSGAQKRIMQRAEGDLIRQCAAVFTVNDSIADEMARRYRCSRPHVLLNVVDPPEGFDVRADHRRLRAHFGWPDDRVILLFQGGLAANRNLENLVESMAFVRNENLVLVLIGDGPIKNPLRDAACALDLQNRVFFKDAVAQEELVFWTASADIGVIPYPDVDLNTRYCTPNKLFEYIQAGLPILANDLPELRRYVGETGFGATVAMREPRAIAAALDDWLADPGKLRTVRETLLAKRDDFTWRASRDSFLNVVNDAFEGRDRKD